MNWNAQHIEKEETLLHLDGVHYIDIFEHFGSLPSLIGKRSGARMNKTDAPPVTVVTSTRNGGVIAVKTIRQNDYPHFEPIVIGWSEDDVAEDSLRPLFANHAIRCILDGALHTFLWVARARAR
jgi:hypothetical protein